ncbi:hypothetical protein EST38_g3147 [Candolleomyces aberdarensis]|uniref:Uncharacterized protein n=1 Tax=Candolleomyces aberdarensis TaxID=2316362 RepID=A0A4Q2DRB4_9AGAR|nr:hypothetical protein EST38_g3147 [Candolleomyces aberdarensis]
MLTDYCHACLRGDKLLFTYMEARTQLCRQCSCEEFKRWNHLPKQIDESLADIIPATAQSLTAKERKEHTRLKRAERTRFYVKIALKLDEELRKIRSKKKKAIWLAEKQAEWKEIEEHAAACERYVHRQAQKRKKWKRDLPYRREDSIREKLIEQGWEEELQLSPYFLKETCWHLLRKSQEFTEQEWDEIKSSVIGGLQRHRVIRILRRKKARLTEQVGLLIRPAYRVHVLSQLPNTIIPSFGDLLMTQDFPPIVELISRGQDIPIAMLDAALRKIPEIFTNWRKDLDETLLDIVRQSSIYSGQDVSKETLRYATTLFLCTQCSDSLAYPAVVFHGCFMKSRSQFHRTSEYNDMSYNQRQAILSAVDPETLSATDLVRVAYGESDVGLNALLGGPPSAPYDVLQFHNTRYHHMTALLDCLSMPRTTSLSALLELDPYVKCHCQCFGEENRRRVKSWIEAIAGCEPHPSGIYDNCFSPANERETRYLVRYNIHFSKRCPLCHVSIGYFHRSVELFDHIRFNESFLVDEAESLLVNCEQCYLP